MKITGINWWNLLVGLICVLVWANISDKIAPENYLVYFCGVLLLAFLFPAFQTERRAR